MVVVSYYLCIFVTIKVCNEWRQKRRKGLKLVSHEESEHQVGGKGV
jgi:hypothetical protein